MNPFHILRIDHVVLRVKDVKRSLSFYQEVLGFKLVKINKQYGLVHLQAGSAMIDLVDINGELGRQGGGTAGGQCHNVDHICLRIDPFEENKLVAHLEKFGLTPQKAEIRFGAEGNGYSIYCSDPDGNKLELKGPASD